MILTPSQRRSFNGVAAARAAMLRRGTTPRGDLLWTADEERILATHWPNRLLIQELLPHRTQKAVASRAGRLGLTSPARRWTGPDVQEQLKPRYPSSEPVGQIADDLVRSVAAVRQKASRKLLRRPRHPPTSLGDPLVDSIRQRAFELSYPLAALGRDVGARRFFSQPTKRARDRAITRALECLGGELEIFRP